MLTKLHLETKSKNDELQQKLIKLDEVIQAGFTMIRILPNVWAGAMVNRFEEERKRELSKNTLQIGMYCILFKENYLVTVKNFSNQTGFSEIRAYLCEQLNQYAYIKPIGNITKYFSENQATNKNQLIAIQNYLLSCYREDLGQFGYCFGEQRLKDKLQEIDDKARLLNLTEKIDEQVLKKLVDTYKKRIQQVINLKKECLRLIDKLAHEWNGYECYLCLRPGVLIVVANMLKEILDQTNDFVTRERNIFGTFSDKDAEKNIKEFVAILKSEMEKIAQVMLWQEQLYQQNKIPDLILNLGNELTSILSSHVKKQFYIKLDFGAKYWQNRDLKLADMLLEYSKKPESPAGVQAYLDFVPRNNNIQQQSKFRRQFIEEFASAPTKLSLKKILPDISTENFAHKIVKVLILFPDRHEMIRIVIKAYFRDHCKLSMLCRDRLFEMKKELSPQEILADIPQLRKTFDDKIINNIANQISLLHALCLKICDPNVWYKILILSASSSHIPFRLCVDQVITAIRVQDVETEEDNLQLKSKKLIEEYVQHKYQLNLSDLSQSMELKRQPNPELSLLYALYQRLDSKTAWSNVLNVDLIRQGLLRQDYLDLIKQLILNIENNELKEACLTQFNVCQRELFKLIQQRTREDLFHLSAKTLIEKYWQNEHELDVGEIKELKDSKKVRDDIDSEVKCLAILYRRLYSLSAWEAALDPKMIKQSRHGLKYLNLLLRIILIINNAELQKECWIVFKICHKQLCDESRYYSLPRICRVLGNAEIETDLNNFLSKQCRTANFRFEFVKGKVTEATGLPANAVKVTMEYAFFSGMTGLDRDPSLGSKLLGQRRFFSL